MANINALVLSHREFKEVEISNTLDALQEIVGGFIEAPYISDMLYENGIDIIINDEGKLIEGMEKEIVIIKEETNQVIDIIFGNCVFVGHNDDGETIGLTEDQINLVKRLLNGGAVLSDYSLVRTIYV